MGESDITTTGFEQSTTVWTSTAPLTVPRKMCKIIDANNFNRRQIKQILLSYKSNLADITGNKNRKCKQISESLYYLPIQLRPTVIKFCKLTRKNAPMPK